jgi:hypothetical protein
MVVNYICVKSVKWKNIYVTIKLKMYVFLYYNKQITKK